MGVFAKLKISQQVRYVCTHKYKFLLGLFLLLVIGLSVPLSKRLPELIDTGIEFALHTKRDKSDDQTRANTGVVGSFKAEISDETYRSSNKEGAPFIQGTIPTAEAIALQNAESTRRAEDVDLTEHQQWLRSHGGDSSNKYSGLTQITPENIGRLKPVWKYESFAQQEAEKKWRTNVEVNPVFADGVLYVVMPDRKLVALDGETGEPIWTFHTGKQPSDRGLLYWQDEKRNIGPYLFLAIGDTIFCIDARTGKRVTTFGNDGWVYTGVSRAAPVVFEDKLIVATIRPVGLAAINISDGQLAWRMRLHPQDASFTGGTPWSGNSLDRDRGLLYVSTGNPRPALYGADRPGPNRNSNSVLAVDLKEKKVRWAFQEVAHDLWDLDVPSPPLLSEIEVAGQVHDVVIAVTKIGNTLILDRDTGKPLYDIPYEKAPASSIPGEVTSSYQPDIKIPEPFINFRFRLSDVTERTPEAHMNVKRQIEGAAFGWFEPPALGKSLVLYGLHGGAEWAGGAVDPLSQTLFVPVNQVPWKIRVYLTSSQPPPSSFSDAFGVYKTDCAQCHGETRNGNYQTRGEADVNFVPSLVGISREPFKMARLEPAAFKDRHAQTVSPDILDAIKKLLISWDQETFSNEAANVNYLWSQLLDQDGYPGTKPPWGEIVAINLVGGKTRWKVPFGYIDDGQGVRKVGTQNFGGLFVTRGGVVFATGTDDRKIVALRASNGEEIWSHQMDAAGSAPPMTYEWNGKQYVVAVSTGGRFHNYREKAGAIYAYALED